MEATKKKIVKPLVASFDNVISKCANTTFEKNKKIEHKHIRIICTGLINLLYEKIRFSDTTAIVNILLLKSVQTNLIKPCAANIYSVGTIITIDAKYITTKSITVKKTK